MTTTPLASNVVTENYIYINIYIKHGGVQTHFLLETKMKNVKPFVNSTCYIKRKTQKRFCVTSPADGALGNHLYVD